VNVASHFHKLGRGKVFQVSDDGLDYVHSLEYSIVSGPLTSPPLGCVGDGAKGDRCLEAESPKNRRPNAFRRVLENPEFGVWMMHDGEVVVDAPGSAQGKVEITPPQTSLECSVPLPHLVKNCSSSQVRLQAFAHLYLDFDR